MLLHKPTSKDCATISPNAIFVSLSFKRIARRRLPPGFWFLSVVSFRALGLAFTLSVFLEQFCNLFASLFVADGLGFRRLADNFTGFLDEGQADEHLRGRLEVADAPLDAASVSVVAVQPVKAQPCVTFIPIIIAAVVSKSPAKNGLGVVRAFGHCQSQRLKQGLTVLPNFPALFPKVWGAFVVRRPTDVDMTAAIVAAGLDVFENAFQRCFDAVQVGPASCLMPFNSHRAILCGNEAVCGGQVGGAFLCVRGVAFKFKTEGPAAARGLAFCLRREGVAFKVRGVVAIRAAADATLMDVCDGLSRGVGFNGVCGVTWDAKNRYGLAAKFTPDTGAGLCCFECGLSDGLNVDGLVLFHCVSFLSM